jgi:hypothetical protein
MPKAKTKFNPALREEFPFLKLVDGTETEVLCTYCSTKFNIGSSGRYSIKRHEETRNHIAAANRVVSNQSVKSYLTTNPSADLLRGKELTFAYHSSKHQISGRASDCNSKLIADFFDQKFTCGRTKIAKLVQQVSQACD